MSKSKTLPHRRPARSPAPEKANEDGRQAELRAKRRTMQPGVLIPKPAPAASNTRLPRLAGILSTIGHVTKIVLAWTLGLTERRGHPQNDGSSHRRRKRCVAPKRHEPGTHVQEISLQTSFIAIFSSVKRCVFFQSRWHVCPCDFLVFECGYVQLGLKAFMVLNGPPTPKLCSFLGTIFS